MIRIDNAPAHSPSWTQAEDEKDAFEAPRFAAIGELFVEALESAPNKPVLHMPVDDGRMTSFLARSLPNVTIALSDQRGGLDFARRAVGRSGLANVAMVHGSLKVLPFPDDQFAGVVCVEHLGHVRQPVNALKEMLRVCAPGGYVVADFMAPRDSTRHLPGMEADGGGYIDTSTGRFYRYMDKMRLEEILGSAGVGSQKPDIIELGWDDASIGGADVRHRRHSWVVVIRKHKAAASS